jgi:hypothetical protein
MADYSKNFEVAMTGLNGLGKVDEEGVTEGDPVPPRPGAKKSLTPKLLYMDGVVGANEEPEAPGTFVAPSPRLLFKDERKINPATGRPFKSGKGGKTVSADEDTLKAIIAHAKAKGLDPYNALAVAMQETEFGRTDPNYGSAWSTFPDEYIEGTRDQNANVLAKALKEKFDYAHRLGVDKKGEAHSLQMYNGYGTLRPSVRRPDGTYEDASYYEIPVTSASPLNLRENPAYGKTVISLRDEILKKDKRLASLVQSTLAYGSTAASPEEQNQAARLRNLQSVKNK